MRTQSTEAAISRAQHGVLTRRQLLYAGVSATQIGRRVRGGRLIPVHRGVYRFGHIAPSISASYLAAVLACRGDALLCGRAAAFMQALVRGSPPPPQVISRSRHRIPGVTCHESSWTESEAVIVRGIPTTSVARTLVDLAGVLGPDALARAAHEASVRYRVGAPKVLAVLVQRPHAKGAQKLRQVMGGETKVLLSELEKAFLRLLPREKLPPPDTNTPAGGRYVDCRWPAFKLTVELDSYRFHATRHAWERDRLREREAYARGDEFRRYTYGDVLEHPAAMLRELRSLLRPR